jgi:hypothetical protein
MAARILQENWFQCLPIFHFTPVFANHGRGNAKEVSNSKKLAAMTQTTHQRRKAQIGPEDPLVSGDFSHVGLGYDVCHEFSD